MSVKFLNDTIVTPPYFQKGYNRFWNSKDDTMSITKFAFVKLHDL